jgi:hypothetical protein
MKKLYLSLLLCMPFVLKAQFLLNPYGFYNFYTTAHTFDTSMYQTGECEADNYIYDANGNFYDDAIYNYKSNGKNLIELKTTYPEDFIFEYITLNYEYENGLLSKRFGLQKKVFQDEVTSSLKDSLGYENKQLKFLYNRSYKDSLTKIIEFIYDPIYGLKSERKIFSKASKSPVYLHEVKEFHAPNLPSILHTIHDSSGDLHTYLISHYYYDSQNRIIGRLDSIFDKGLFRPNETIQVVYRNNSTQIDSMITYNFKRKSSIIKQVIYGTKNKVSFINTFNKDSTNKITQTERLEFLDAFTSLEDQLKNKISLKLFPNPTSDKIFIESKENIKQVEVFDLNGKRLLNKEEDRIEQIDLSELVTGVYLLKAKSDLGLSQAKIIKTN